MTANLTASDLRRFAMRCVAEAGTVSSAEERERLRKMADAFLQLAGNEDWLSGNWRAHPSLQDDPAIQALADRLMGKAEDGPKNG